MRTAAHETSASCYNQLVASETDGLAPKLLRSMSLSIAVPVGAIHVSSISVQLHLCQCYRGTSLHNNV